MHPLPVVIFIMPHAIARNSCFPNLLPPFRQVIAIL